LDSSIIFNKIIKQSYKNEIYIQWHNNINIFTPNLYFKIKQNIMNKYNIQNTNTLKIINDIHNIKIKK